MFTFRWLCLCLSVSVTLLLSGCARVWLEDPGNLLGQAELVNPVPTEISTTDLFPLQDAKGRFLVIEGDNDGLKFSWTLKSSSDGWIYNYQGLQKVWFIQDETGALYITREDDFEEEVRVVYEPAILALPALLNSQTAHEQKVEMTVTSLNGKEVRSRGPCYNSITLLGRQTISTPAGEFEAVVVRSKRRVQLPIAKVEIDILSAYVPGRGQVAERISQQIKALNFFDMEEVREIRLAK